MMDKIEQFLDWAEAGGWQVERRESLEIDLPGAIQERYPKIPPEFLEFLKLVKSCVTPDEKAWFLCLDDYHGTGDSAFKWNEMEQMSLVEGDDDYNEPIISFWDNYLPIALSVRNDYAYYAINVKDDFGRVVYGFEPEFEEPSPVSTSLIQFLEAIMSAKIEFGD
jgi:hypothetical protein